jgi:hypothetical protein
MSLTKPTTFATLACVALLAGCGGSGGDNSPKGAASAYFKALQSGDYGAACDKIASTSKQKLQAAAKGKSCPDALAVGLKSAQGSNALKTLKDATFGEPTIKGDRGTVPVKVKALGTSLPIPVVKEGGAWKVESSAAVGG